MELDPTQCQGADGGCEAPVRPYLVTYYGGPIQTTNQKEVVQYCTDCAQLAAQCDDMIIDIEPVM